MLLTIPRVNTKALTNHNVWENSTMTPRVNVVETADHVSVCFEVPGLSEKDIQVVVKKGVLTVSATKTTDDMSSKGTVHRREIRTGSFERSFSLPEGVNLDAVDAVYKHGVLTVTIPKTEEEKPKTITVRVD